jgi:hypothetical protein
MIPITWTFALSGMELFGPVKKAPGGLTYQLVTIENLTKWVEVKPLAKIGSKQAVDFIQDIIFHFRVLNSNITNNDTQFTREKFLDFFDNNNIHVDWVVVAHLCTNEQLERANGMILQGLKPHILTQDCEEVHTWLNTQVGKWASEVPSILQSLQRMPNRSIGVTPFFMVYGGEVVKPTNLQYGSPRVQAYQPDMIEEA